MLSTSQAGLQDLIASTTVALWLLFVVERLEWAEVAGSAWQKVRFLRLRGSSRRQQCVDVSNMCPLWRQSYSTLGTRWVVLGWNASCFDRFIASRYCLVSPDKPWCSTSKQGWPFPCTLITFITIRRRASWDTCDVDSGLYTDLQYLKFNDDSYEDKWILLLSLFDIDSCVR